MKFTIRAAVAVGILCSIASGASAHYYVPGGYDYYKFGPYRHAAVDRFYACEHFTCNSGCCPIGESIQHGFCRSHVENNWYGLW